MIKPNSIEHLDWLDSNYATNVSQLDIYEIISGTPDNFIDLIHEKLLIAKYDQNENVEVTTQVINETTNYIFEILYVESLTNKECYIISKNLIQNKDNYLYFEVLFYHHIREGSEIPKTILAYKRIKESQTIFWPKYKAFYYPGHTRFHKVKFLEFLYQNNFLDEIIWSSTSPDFDKPVFRDFVPQEFESEFNSFEVLKLLPKRIDFNLFSKDVYNSRGGQINLVTYLDTTFEIVAETRFHETTGKAGSKKTIKTWNNISEKTIKPTMLSHPFILIAKQNTIKLLEDRGLKYRYDFWNYDYDSIEDAEDRLRQIESFTKKVMNLKISELKEFNKDYSQFSKTNYNVMLNDVYIKSINDIWNKF